MGAKSRPMFADQIRCLKLSESEVGEMLAAVVEFDDEHSTGSFPSLVRLPDVVVLVSSRVVTQTTATRVDCFFDHQTRFAGIALILT